MLQRGQSEEATRLFQDILKQYPDNLDAIVNLIYLARFPNHGTQDDVETLYKKALQIDPGIPRIYGYYGAVMASQGKFDAAVAAMNKAIELKPDYADAHLWLGGVLEQQNRAAEAIAQYRLALAAQPAYRPAQLELGRILVNLGRHREAIPELLPALKVDDANTPIVMLYLAQAYANLGDLEKAREYLKQARIRVSKTGPPELLEQIDKGLTQLGSRP